MLLSIDFRRAGHSLSIGSSSNPLISNPKFKTYVGTKCSFIQSLRIQTLNKFFESFHGIKMASNNGGGLSPKRYLASILYASLRFHRPRVINMEDASMIPRSFINLIEYYRHCFHFQLVSSFSS